MNQIEWEKFLLAINIKSESDIRVSYATSMAELDRGLERMRKFFGGL